MCNCNDYRGMDIKTPRNVYLSPFYKRSFGFHTVKNRMPVILTKLIDNLVRSKDEIGAEFGQQGKDELKTVVGQISKLKYEIVTNKPIAYFTGSAPDIALYNDYIKKQVSEEGQPTYFHTIFLLSECSMYRRLRQIFESTTVLNSYDYFAKQKIESYETSLPFIIQLSEYLLQIAADDSIDNAKIDFISLLKINLWGNKCDLSLSLGKVEEHGTSLFNTDAFEPYILCDHSDKIFPSVFVDNAPGIIDIIHDNAGYELFTDFCLADYILSKKLAKQVRLFVKSIPWFISDTMIMDIHRMLADMKENEDVNVCQLSHRWTNYLQNGSLSIEESDFWTLPHDFSMMATTDPNLYKKLSEAKLMIIKGDLNYRKLFGEKNWDPYTPLEVGMQGFHPTKIVTLRTLKCDIICGLETEGMVDELDQNHPDWLTTGDFGVIQFCDKVVPID